MKKAHPFFIIFVLFAIYSAIIIITTWPINEFSISKSGVFGDSFGALNALFTGLGFAGLLVTLRQQQSQLDAQSKKDEIQDRQQKQERFESHFFKLLDLYSTNLEKIRYSEHGESLYGVDALRAINSRISQAINTGMNITQVTNMNDDELLVHDYNYITSIKQQYVLQSRYLETLECLMTFTEKECQNEDKAFYWRIIETQLTSVEYKYLFYSVFTLPDGSLLRECIIKNEGTLAAMLCSVNSKTKRKIIERRLRTKIPNTQNTQAPIFIEKPEIQAARKRIKNKKKINTSPELLHQEYA